MMLFLIINLLLQFTLFTIKAQEVGSPGAYATEGQFPFMGAIYLNNELVCGGSIISEYFVLTAGHCLYNRNPNQMSVIVGTNELKPGLGMLHNITSTLIHSQYQSKNNDFDIGLIEVMEPIKLESFSVDIIQLSEMQEDYPHYTVATVIGYALKIDKAYERVKLKYGQIPMWNREECDSVIKPSIPDHMICAAHLTGEVSLCEGDSGGPLVIEDKLYGVVSFGYGCGTDHPTVFIRVPSFRSWVMENADL